MVYNACRIAGINARRIINEPTAAVLANGIDSKDDQKVMVYDLGGGTFDVSILDMGYISDMGCGVVEALATAGYNNLGCNDFDEVIVMYLLDMLKKEFRIDFSSDITVCQRLREAAEIAKADLSVSTTTQISVPYITVDDSGSKHLNCTLTRSKFDELTAHLVEKTIDLVSQALSDSELSANSLSKVLLVGGASRIVAVHEAIKKKIGKAPFKGINSDECVAVGAAVQGGVLNGDIDGILLVDITPLSYGIGTANGIVELICSNQTIPIKRSTIFTTATDNQQSVEFDIMQGVSGKPQSSYSKIGKMYFGIPPARQGIPQIEVAFDIDANGMLNVTALDLGIKEQRHISESEQRRLEEKNVKRRNS